MFWGLTLNPGKRHTEVFAEEICVSMATLESRKDFGERPDNFSHVVVKRGKMDYLLCTLVHGIQFQQNLNLKLMPKEKITFKVQGTSTVYLTGFTPTCPVDDPDANEEEEDEEEEEEEETGQTVQARITVEREETGWLVDEPSHDASVDPIEDVIESLSGEEFNQTEEQTERTGEGTTKDDNFLSIAELGNLPLKVEVQDADESPETAHDLANDNSATNSNNGHHSTTRDEEMSSGDESENDWIIDDHLPGPVETVNETEFNVDIEGTVSYPCTQCNRRFDSDAVRLQHEKSSHPAPGPPPLIRMTNEGIKYQCKYCSKLLANRNTLKRHEALHRGNRRFLSCKHCQRVCNNTYNRMRHETVCGKKAARGKALGKVKSSSKVYRCLICDISFDQIQARDKHVLQHFKKDAQRCDLCRQVTCKGECVQTGEMLNSQTKIIKHDMPGPTGLWKCHVCPKRFTLKASRTRHMKIHFPSSSASDSGIKAAAADVSPNKGDDTKECKYCYKAFQSDVLLKTHERTHIGEERPFSCKCCKKTFLDHLGRRKHELRHPEMRMFSCKFCHKRFSRKNLWEIHESHHTEERPYKCRYCERDFSNQSNRTNHETAHKTRGDVELMPTVSVTADGEDLPSTRSPTGKLARLPCRFCGKKFVTKGGRQKHERKSHKVHGGFPQTAHMPSHTAISCNTCGLTFQTQVRLAMHSCGQSEAQTFHCKVCDARFNNKVSMMRHQATHSRGTAQASKQCRYCKKVLSSRYAVVVHERIHTGEKPFACNQCDFRTNDKSHLTKHVRRHSSNAPYTLKCSLCHHKFMSQYSLKIHEAQHRAEKMVLTCTMCDIKFPSREELDAHMQSHVTVDDDPIEKREEGVEELDSIENNQSNDNEDVVDDQEEGTFRPYRCTYCDQTFSTPESLQSHEHIHEKEQPFKCDKCGRSFRTNIGMERHSLTCLEGKPHKCRYCSKCFSTEKGCHLHEESHIVQRPFKCSQCDRGFLSTHSREMHEKTHTL